MYFLLHLYNRSFHLCNTHNNLHTIRLLKKLLEKGAVRRDEPGFVLTPLVSRDEVARDKTIRMVDKMYNGSMKLFLTGLLGGSEPDEKTMAEINDLIERARQEGGR